jgi:hypothetical protein
MAVNSGRGTAATFLGRRRLLLQASAAGVAAVALRPALPTPRRPAAAA